MSEEGEAQFGSLLSVVPVFVLAEISNTLCADIDQEVQNSCSKTCAFVIVPQKVN